MSVNLAMSDHLVPALVCAGAVVIGALKLPTTTPRTGLLLLSTRALGGNMRIPADVRMTKRARFAALLNGDT